ncbi:hypothetical protein HID58_017166 [Brassica napus]|uniref:Cell number regulator 6 n=1 Tax=Brassica napus TaxID=3708 RepID=A0ABQ8D8U4_BRANA|nr:hypothetical protein HID58_017166 [Brassica napus]
METTTRSFGSNLLTGFDGGGKRRFALREIEERAGSCGRHHPRRTQPAHRCSSGRTGLFCPCVLYGRNIEAVRDEIPWTQPCVCHAVCVEGGMALAAVTALFGGYIDPQTTVVICEGLFFAWWMCGIYSGLFRQELQKKYHLKNAPCDHCMVHCCLHWCALCQEHREMKNHLSDADASSSTTMDPPPVQAMNTEENKDASSSSSSSPSSAKSQHNDLEMVPL